MKRQVGGGGVMLRFMEIKVIFGRIVTYSNKKLEFIDNRNNRTIPGMRCVLYIMYCMQVMHLLCIRMWSPNLSRVF